MCSAAADLSASSRLDSCLAAAFFDLRFPALEEISWSATAYGSCLSGGGEGESAECILEETGLVDAGIQNLAIEAKGTMEEALSRVMKLCGDRRDVREDAGPLAGRRGVFASRLELERLVERDC